MEKKVAGLIVSPLWRELMDKVLPTLPVESFIDPEPEDYSKLKPVLRGELLGEAHSILYWVDKDNPRGPVPTNPGGDPQFANWEYGVRRWAISASQSAVTPTTVPTQIIIPAVPGPGVF